MRFTYLLACALLAVIFAARAASAADTLGRDGAAAADALARAEAFHREGRKESVAQARTLYQKSIALWKGVRDGCGARRAGVAWSTFEHDLSNWEGQMNAAQTALAEACNEDILQQALAERLLGSAHINQGDFAAGARATERAVTLFQKLGDAHEEGATLRNLGLAYAESGEVDHALAVTRSALKVADRTDDARLLALLRNDLALIYNVRGEFASAVDAYQKSLEGLREKPYPMAEAVAWINLGIAYGQLGDAEQALAAYAKGEAAASSIDCSSCLAEIEVDRGDDLFDQGDLAKAQAAYERALQIAKAHQLVRQRAEALRGLGRCAMENQRWAQARALFESAREELHRTHGRVNESIVYIMLGDLDSRTGELANARRNYEQALKLAREASNQAWQAVAHASLARLSQQHGDLPSAKRSMERAIALIESERTSITAPDLRSGYLSTKRSYYELYIDILMQIDRAQRSRDAGLAALIVAEHARARELQDQLAQRAISIDSRVDPQLLEAQSAAADRLRSLAYQLSQVSATDETHRKELQERIDEASRHLDAARGRIRAANPRYAELMHPTNLRADEIRGSLLDDDVSVLEFWLGEKQSYLWLVTRDAVQAFTLPARATIEQAAASLREKLLAPTKMTALGSIEQRSAAETSALEDVRVSAGALLDQILPEPARPLLRRVAAIVPDGGLQSLPFSIFSLTRESASAASVAYVYLPSMSTLRSLRTLPHTQAAPRSLVVIADPVFRADDERLHGRASVPVKEADALVLRAASEAGVADLARLPFTREEAQTIATLADRASWVVLDFAANRATALDAQWSSYAVAHFATHALVNARHPELSGIVLSLYDANGRGQDGFLRASDIYNLRIPADLVVLSVCDSAVGKDVGAEGPATLSRAFFYAGARRVVASLWPVDDRASVAFMHAFYQALFTRGMTPQEALSAAQGDLKQNRRWRAPYYWAPYVLQGDWR